MVYSKVCSSKTVSEEIQEYPVKNANGLQHHNQGIKNMNVLGKKNMNGSHNNLFNLIALIASLNSTCDKNGTLKLSYVKATKVSKLCDDIESLISNSEPSLSQVLLSQYI